MEFLKSFEVPAKNPSEEAQRRWRDAVGTLVKNRRRRFRMVPDLDKRSQAETQRRKIQVRTCSLQFHRRRRRSPISLSILPSTIPFHIKVILNFLWNQTTLALTKFTKYIFFILLALIKLI